MNPVTIVILICGLYLIYYFVRTNALKEEVKKKQELIKNNRDIVENIVKFKSDYKNTDKDQAKIDKFLGK